MIDYGVLNKYAAIERCISRVRNLAIHDDQTVEFDIVESLLRNHLDDFLDFERFMLTSMAGSSAA